MLLPNNSIQLALLPKTQQHTNLATVRDKYTKLKNLKCVIFFCEIGHFLIGGFLILNQNVHT